MRYFGGSSNSLAEIIIDYRKKSVKILNPITKKPFKKEWLPSILYLSLSFILSIVYSLFYGVTIYTYLLIPSFFVMIWGVTFLFPQISQYSHLFQQFLLNDIFTTKKLVIVKNLKSKIYKLPYKFKNIKLDYKCYNDFSKYLLKIHIFPKDYYFLYGKRKEVQRDEWEAWFYFSKIPSKGRMEVIFI